MIKFVPFSKFLEEHKDVSPNAMSVPSFAQDIGLLSGIGEISQSSQAQAFIPTTFPLIDDLVVSFLGLPQGTKV